MKSLSWCLTEIGFTPPAHNGIKARLPDSEYIGHAGHQAPKEPSGIAMEEFLVN